MTIRRFAQVLFAVLLLMATITAVLIVFAALNRRALVSILQGRLRSYQLAIELRQSSDDLTRFARTYAATGDPKYERYYRQVLAIRNGEEPRPVNYQRIHWDERIATGAAGDTGEKVALMTLMQRAKFTAAEIAIFKESVDRSNELAQLEETAMQAVKGRYRDSSGSFTRTGPPDPDLARRLLFDDSYHQAKARIMQPIDAFLAMTEERANADLDTFTRETARAFVIIQSVLVLFFLTVALSYPLVRSRVLSPVLALQEQTRAVAADLARLSQATTRIAQGDLKQSFTISSPGVRSERKDEIGTLSLLHDSMIGQLEETGSAISTITVELSRTKEYMQEILNSTPIAVGVSVDGVCRYANPRYREMFGRGIGESTVNLYQDLAERERILKLLERQGTVKEQFVKLRNAEGRELHLLCTFDSIRFDGSPAILGWVIDVTELKQVQVELERKYDELRRLERLRDDLIHMIIHDLRSPLTAIAGYLQLLQEDRSILAEKHHRYVDNAATGTMTLIEMITSLLDISRLEAGQMPLRRERCDLSTVATRAITSLAGLAIGRNVSVEHPEAPLWIHCDPGIMQRVISNLVGNAIKFTPKSGSVTVVVIPQADGARVEVRDTGYGIEREYLEKVFDKFAQVEAREENKNYSTGLGLTFCKLATEAHGGRIGVASEVGKGSTFWFELPAHVGAEAEGQAAGQA